ncbi:MAG: UDP-N-acetylmuramoyl-L-alanine--D-glutamate ligase [Corallococcus sp.]|nr:UDP-N-acetylmuramoyl-L-alanine--D-glutamate ligase [Corallococcus sp.]
MSNIVIFGMGKTGNSLKRLLENKHNLWLFDDNPNKSSLKFSDIPLEAIDEVIVSPGVNYRNPIVKEFKKKNIPVIGELQYCFENCNSPCISVTGTNGKTTVTQLINYILNQNGIQGLLLGNGGKPFSEYLSCIKPDNIVVLESSSFQLENFASFSPYISVFTNLHFDHLDYHETYNNYIEAKCNNFTHQTKEQFAIFNLDDANVTELSKRCIANKLFYSVDKECNCYLKKNTVCIDINGNMQYAESSYLDKLSLFNKSNVLCALLVCSLLGVNLSSALEAVSSFTYDKHRTEFAGKKENVIFVDDSKATNLHATLAAIDSIQGNLALILGGSDKGYSFDILFKNTDKIKFVAAIGETANNIFSAACKNNFNDIIICDNLHDAVCKCYESIRQDGGTVLLSPACASFDMFSGYAERGELFCKIAEEICNA